MDQIDLHLDVPAVDYEKLADSRRGESSKTIWERVMNARKKQDARFEGSPTHTNSGMSWQELETHAQPSEASKKLLENAMSRMGLSARSYDRMLKGARTIADLEGEEASYTSHVAEAIQYRNLDRPA